MTATDVIRELGDPEKMCGLEDHVLLKLDRPWQSPRRSTLPRGLHLEDGGQLVTATADSFIAHSKILSKLRVVAAVLAGCAALDSCQALASVARKVLAKAKTLVFVHNRDNVLNLVDWFRSVEVIVLHHDLRLQDVPDDFTGFAGNRKPQLKRLIGSFAAMGMDNLFITPQTMCQLICCSPQLYEVQTPMHHVLDRDDIVLTMTLMTNPCLRTSSSLVLGRIIYRLDGRTTANPLDEVTPDVMVRASSFFPRIRVWSYARGSGMLETMHWCLREAKPHSREARTISRDLSVSWDENSEDW